MTTLDERYKILIVDDDPQIHKLLGKMLPVEKFSVESSYTADEAITTIDSISPDLIVLDIMMPKISGIEVLNFVRKEEKHKETLILILSAKDAQDDRLSGLSQGADDYVAKPFHMKHLVRKIEHMIDKRDEEKKSIN
jgi:two-component system alkaline phosphatase synthesis response regulator PhoP